MKFANSWISDGQRPRQVESTYIEQPNVFEKEALYGEGGGSNLVLM